MLNKFIKAILDKDISIVMTKIISSIIMESDDKIFIEDLCDKTKITKKNIINALNNEQEIKNIYNIKSDNTIFTINIFDHECSISQRETKIPKKKRNTKHEIKIKQLFDLWKNVMSKSVRNRIDNDKRKIIIEALDKYEFTSCEKAIIGCSFNSKNMKEDKHKTIKENSLHSIFRNEESVYFFIDLYELNKEK